MSAGLATFPALPYDAVGAGLRTVVATLLPPGGRVTYVRSTGVQTGDGQEIAQRLFLTLDAALQECRSGLGDVIICLPGHTESVTGATFLANLVAGTRIIGFGNGSARPTFRWTATTSQMAVSVADVVFQGLKFRMEGAVVVKAFAVTGADVVFDGCEFETASGASNYAAIGIEFGTGAARATIQNCKFRGITATGASNIVKITGTAQDGITIRNTTMIAPGHTTTGLIQVNNAATNLLFSNLVLYNTVASSTTCICLDDFASDGFFVDIDMMDKNDGTATAQGITFGSSTLVGCSRCYEVDEKKKNSILSPAVGT